MRICFPGKTAHFIYYYYYYCFNNRPRRILFRSRISSLCELENYAAVRGIATVVVRGKGRRVYLSVLITGIRA